MKSRCLALSCLVLALTAVMVAPASARRSPQKAMWGPAYPSELGGASQFPIYRDLGVTIFQLQLSWNDIAATRRPKAPRNPNDPAYEWRKEHDRAVREARRNGMRVMIQVIGAPKWSNGGRPFNFSPKRTKDYANFMAAVARRYPSVNLWTIWGEPSRRANFAPLTSAPPGRGLTLKQAAAPRRYARLLDASYKVLKRDSRRNLVIGGDTYTTGDIRTRQWIRYMRLPSGRPPRMDFYGHNPFSFRRPNLRNPASPEGVVDFSDLGRLSRFVNRQLAPRGKRLRLYLTEFTIPASDDPTIKDPELGFINPLAGQANWIRAAWRIVHTLGPSGPAKRTIYAFGWVHLRDVPGQTLGGLLFQDGRKKPGYKAFKAG